MLGMNDKQENLALAHVRQSDGGVWHKHLLDKHLRDVAKLAADFAAGFDSSDWASIAGLWHDLGKYSTEFQRYIQTVSGYDRENAHIEGGAPGRVDHSTAGAIYAVRQFDKHGRILAYLIAGHHAGLPDWDSADTGRKALSFRLEKSQLLDRIPTQAIPQNILMQSKPPSKVCGGENGFHLWVRMLFSCLVDADFLDTEFFMDKGKNQARQQFPALAEMLPIFNRAMEAKVAQLIVEQSAETPVNRIRADVLAQCRKQAALSPGMFSLTVPTGGGKTLSSLAFALEHAKHHSKDHAMRRIIYAIPYTSIIEQTADVFRGIFGRDDIVEHHSNFDVDRETTRSRLAAENWDAPLIVTTNVQLFESLFAARTSRCRKLHNLVNSVIVLDEAQLLPPEFLQPILDTLNLLTTHYGVTIVLSTATQPALNTVKDNFGRTTRKGLNNVREIIADVDGLYADLERVEVQIPADFNQPTDWESLAAELCHHDTVLAIVNTRKDCRELWELMPKGTLHLSALLCGAHRSAIIADIKERLKCGEAVRVISTQLVEAGVDLDFPVVYRALAGLDSIAQAAGRCNREGALKGKGKVVVFVPPKPAPRGLLRFGEDATKDVWHKRPEKPLARELFTRYFNRFLSMPNLDEHDIAGSLKCGSGLEVQFRTAAEKFRLIDDRETQAVFVRYNAESNKLIQQLNQIGPKRDLMRKLQRHSVTIYRHDLNRLLQNGDIKAIENYPDLYAQVGDTLYHKKTGLLLAESPILNPSTLAF
ncbi:CRISPR-associated endonuclease Cas3'' [Candidatus Nitrotoga arctica]|uniref:CRISPR-associated helicase Cas3 n=1 Tax=Candidatus Nitrotoga arctica TaxID=453162 RepID=A0ABM8YYR4_9PROT|nr:CRISPR-associated endonuclease Cas3'' [Candidatus Nitrotoga arctica]CAG9932586.1 CRISPR-associated helicase Cas3 [Candidatus Nitrotoga arctica]